MSEGDKIQWKVSHISSMSGVDGETLKSVCDAANANLNLSTIHRPDYRNYLHTQKEVEPTVSRRTYSELDGSSSDPRVLFLQHRNPSRLFLAKASNP